LLTAGRSVNASILRQSQYCAPIHNASAPQRREQSSKSHQLTDETSITPVVGGVQMKNAPRSRGRQKASATARSRAASMMRDAGDDEAGETGHWGTPAAIKGAVTVICNSKLV
jgi:hypothetical protein